DYFRVCCCHVRPLVRPTSPPVGSRYVIPRCVDCLLLYMFHSFYIVQMVGKWKHCTRKTYSIAIQKSDIRSRRISQSDFHRALTCTRVTCVFRNAIAHLVDDLDRSWRWILSCEADSV